jgi:hypothetical protein
MDVRSYPLAKLARYTCPLTGDAVANLEIPRSEDTGGVIVTCPACLQPHVVSPVTGELLAPKR